MLEREKAMDGVVPTGCRQAPDAAWVVAAQSMMAVDVDGLDGGQGKEGR